MSRFLYVLQTTKLLSALWFERQELLRALTILSSVLLSQGGVTLVDTPPYCSWPGGALLAQALAATAPVLGPQSPSFCENAPVGPSASAGGGSKFGETGARRPADNLLLKTACSHWLS